MRTPRYSVLTTRQAVSLVLTMAPAIGILWFLAAQCVWNGNVRNYALSSMPAVILGDPAIVSLRARFLREMIAWYVGAGVFLALSLIPLILAIRRKPGPRPKAVPAPDDPEGE